MATCVAHGSGIDLSANTLPLSETSFSLATLSHRGCNGVRTAEYLPRARHLLSDEPNARGKKVSQGNSSLNCKFPANPQLVEKNKARGGTDVQPPGFVEYGMCRAKKPKPCRSNVPPKMAVGPHANGLWYGSHAQNSGGYRSARANAQSATVYLK